MKINPKSALILACSLAIAGAASAQVQYSSRTSYLTAVDPNLTITPIITTTDLVQKTGAAPGVTYEVGGVPDGLGAYDNGDGTITVLNNHELLTSALGVTRDHGGTGAYVEELIIRKSDLAVLSSSDLMKNVIDTAGTVHNAANGNALAFGRFCSADLAPATGLSFGAFGTSERLFMHGEEGPATGWNMATVASGANKGNSYILGQFNLTTNGSGLTGVGSWENTLVNPTSQLKTVVAANSDGGTGIMANSVMIYQGTKTNVGSEVDKAGLTNGTLKFVAVNGFADNNPGGTAAANLTIEEFGLGQTGSNVSRASAITSGTPFTLSSTTSTTFSRPEDGAWNPLNPNQYYFVTTDRLDTSTAGRPTDLNQTNPTAGATGAGVQIGMSRLWRLNFANIANPDAGGTIDLLINGGLPNQKIQMFDNMTVAADGNIYLNEDPGNSTYNGKIWQFNPVTGKLTMLTKFDVARWGDLTSADPNGTAGATSPYTDDKETSGILDVTSLFTSSAAAGEHYLLTTVQDHSSNAAVSDTVTTEGGQLLLIHQVPEPTTAISLIGGLGMLLGLRRRRA